MGSAYTRDGLYASIYGNTSSSSTTWKHCFTVTACRQHLLSVHNQHHSTEHNINSAEQMWHSSTTTQIVYCSVILITSGWHVTTGWWWWYMLIVRWTFDISSMTNSSCTITACYAFNGFLLRMLLKFHTDIIIIIIINDEWWTLLLTAPLFHSHKILTKDSNS